MSLADLGRRAVACKHWRWMPGMTVLGAVTWRVVERQDLPPYMVCGYDEKSIDDDDLPKLDDPATLGCLLALVEEQHGDVVLNESGGEWECWIYLGNGRGMFQYSGGTRIEALVAALEAAP